MNFSIFEVYYMEIFFNNDELEKLYENGKPTSKDLKSNPTLVNQFLKTMKKLMSISRVEQLNQFGGLHYEKLTGDRKGESCVRLNKQFRLIFIEMEDDSDTPKVVALRIEKISKHYE